MIIDPKKKAQALHAPRYRPEAFQAYTPSLQMQATMDRCSPPKSVARSQAPFRSPEHCLAVAFAFQQLRIEPRNATSLVIEILRARRGMQSDFDRVPSDLSQHEWHAQAVMAVSFVRRTLEGSPLLWQAVQAEYSHGVDGALAVQAISNHADPDAQGRERLITDALTANLLRGTPRYREIADRFDISLDALSRRSKAIRGTVLGLRDRAIDSLMGPMEESGLIG